MQPKFIVLDLDGTIIDEKTHKLIPGVKEALLHLSQKGHFLSVCSNNAMAKHILSKLEILSFFDFVIGHSSTSYKAEEMLDCWEFYRYLFNSKQIRWKIHLKRIIFVDDSEDTLCELQNKYQAINLFSSVALLMEGISSLPTGKSGTIETARSKIHTQYGKPPVRESSYDMDSLVSIDALAKSSLNQRGSKNMRYHNNLNCGALRRHANVVHVLASDCVVNGHKLCKLCRYNRQLPVTHKFCCYEPVLGNIGT